MMKRPPILWLLCDGKPGHDNQSLGLAAAIRRRLPAEIHRITPGGRLGAVSRVRSALRTAADLPLPDLIMAAGHTTHLPLLCLARRFRAKSIVLMKPSLPLSWFDLCIAPEHDFPMGGNRPNVILTRGALNRVTPADGERHGRLVLIGGPSKTHGWDGRALLDMLAQITADGGWELTDSRRTPGDFLTQLGARLPGVTIFPHTRTPSDWLPEKLRAAREVWVTEDSVSMIYEALSSGARVGLLPVPRLKRDSRVLRGIDALLADGYLTSCDRWQAEGRLAAPPAVLDEAGRCAALLADQFGLADPSRGLH